MKIKWIVTCEKVIFEDVTKNFSIINIFDKSTFSSLPASHSFFVAGRVEETGKGDTVQLSILKSNGDILKSLDWVEFKGNFTNMNVAFAVENLQFLENGFYEIRLTGNDGATASARLEISS